MSGGNNRQFLFKKGATQGVNHAYEHPGATEVWCFIMIYEIKGLYKSSIENVIARVVTVRHNSVTQGG
jgi:hypothetical protein